VKGYGWIGVIIGLGVIYTIVGGLLDFLRDGQADNVWYGATICGVGLALAAIRALYRMA
jgi:hypothetical protein